ncbi:MAG: EamA family transporter [Acetilactobacillus jinshanensis]
MSMVGIVLVLTKGNFSKLSISIPALMWGIGAGLGQALYLICPVPLTKHHYPPIIILGWGP